MRKLLALLLLLLVPAAEARTEVRVFEQAERAYSHGWGVMPQEGSMWTAQRLPHNWHVDGTGGEVWYRIRFNLEGAWQGEGSSLYLPKVRLNNLKVYANQEIVWRLTDHYAPSVSVPGGVRIPLRPGLLRAGTNTIHLVATGSPRWYEGVPRLYFGSTRALTEQSAFRKLMQDEIRYVVAAAFGTIGILSLWLWLRAGRDPVLFWYGVSASALLVATAAWHAAQWQSDIGWRLATIFMRYHGYLVPFFVLHLRLAERKHPWLEGALWIVLLAALVGLLDINHSAWVGWSLTFSVLPALLTIPLLMSPQLRSKPSVIFLIVADLAACVLPLHDWAWRMGYIDFDRPYLTYFAPAFVILAAAIPIIERVQAGIRAGEQNRLELERRVVEKTREIEASHEQLRQAQREATLADERRRIMADMHDGIGARLVALLSIAQSGRARHGEITDGLAAALDELRLTVDSVQPVEGDVSVVLGNVRHRMRSVFERSGIKLNWNVSELPRMEDLTPERILAIQRIFLEAFSNAIRHSGARTVSVYTVRVPGAVRIVIEDDGGGFDVDAPHAGTGLHNLQLRALQAGGTLQVVSESGKGTRATLSLPLGGGDTQKPLPDTGQTSEIYPVVGIPANATSS